MYLLLAIVIAPFAAYTSSVAAAVGQFIFEGRANEVITVSWMSDGGTLLAGPVFYVALGIALLFLIPYLLSLYQVVSPSIALIRKAIIA